MRQNRDKNFGIGLSDLRAAAEEIIAHRSATETATPHGDALLHELQVHQIELDMQNEELRRAQAAVEVSRDRYMDLYEFAPVGYLTLSREAIITEVNLTCAAFLGVDRKRLLHHRFSSYVALEDKEQWYRHFLTVLRQKGEQSFELALVNERRATVYALLSCVHISKGDSSIIRVALTDITPLKKAEEELRIAAIAFETQEAMVLTDTRGTIMRINEGFTHRTGYKKENIVGKNITLLQSGRHDLSFFQKQSLDLRKQRHWKGEMWNRSQNGNIYAEWVTIAAVTDQKNLCTHYLYTFSDITRNREAEAEIHRLAYYDALTRLPNRRMLVERMGQALAGSKRDGSGCAIIFLDLDHFKALNDTLGHDVGDQLLVEVARRLHSTLCEGDPVLWSNSTVSRLGGDEFVVLLEGMSSSPSETVIEARLVAEKLQETLSAPYCLASADFSCTISMGITLFGDRALEVNTLLKEADLALYQCKKNGGGTYCFFDSAMQATIALRHAEEVSLRHALDSDEFQLYYQPQTNESFQVVGAEALLRWKHPERGLTSPQDFIDLAEQTRLVLPIGQWVLESACCQIRSWSDKKETRNLILSINVSARQFHHPGFVQEVKRLLLKTSADPTRLMIDLSEAVVLANMKKTISTVQSLREFGVDFSLDGFGSGLSSLTYLKRMPVQQLKIDGTLVRNIMSAPCDAGMVSAIITMGRALGFKVNAQGIETQDQLSFLKTHGCNSYQGYLISPPLPPEGFEPFLAIGASKLRKPDRDALTYSNGANT